MGREGRQAARCSDFAIARFRFLRRVLLVHGHWYYRRLSTLVHYFFYKNVVFITPQLYFAAHSLWSTQPLYGSMFLSVYNLFFTSVPVVVFALLDQHYSANTLQRFPQLYADIRQNALLSWGRFLGWTVAGVWHSVVIYFLPWWVISNNPAILIGSTVDQWAFGTIVYHCAVCIANLRLWITSRYWTAFFLATLLVSVVGFMVFTLVYSIIFVQGPDSSMLWVYLYLTASPSFWLLSLLTVVLGLLPDCALPALTPVFSRLRSMVSKLSIPRGTRWKKNWYHFHNTLRRRRNPSIQATRYMQWNNQPLSATPHNTRKEDAPSETSIAT